MRARPSEEEQKRRASFFILAYGPANAKMGSGSTCKVLLKLPCYSHELHYTAAAFDSPEETLRYPNAVRQCIQSMYLPEGAEQPMQQALLHTCFWLQRKMHVQTAALLHNVLFHSLCCFAA